MNHAVSIISFLNYFGMGIVAFVVLQVLVSSRRLRRIAGIRRWFRGTVKPVFIEVYQLNSQQPSDRHIP